MRHASPLRGTELHNEGDPSHGRIPLVRCPTRLRNAIAPGVLLAPGQLHSAGGVPLSLRSASAARLRTTSPKVPPYS